MTDVAVPAPTNEQPLNYSELVPHSESTATAKPKTGPVRRLYWYSIVTGYAMLAPWNGVLTCIYFFQLLYMPGGYHPEYTLPMVMFLPLVVGQLFLIAYGSKFPARAKMVGGFAMLTFFFYIFLYCCKYIENLKLSFMVAIINTLMIGLFNAVSQSTGLGVCGALGCDGYYMSAAMIGNGISGVLSNLLQFACLALVGNRDEDLFHVTSLFFMVTGILMIICTYVSYLLAEDPLTASIVKSTKQESLKETLKMAWPVFKGQGKNVFMVFVFTFIVFPGVTLANPLQFVSKQWAVPIMIFLFNIFDTIGRYSPSYIPLASPKGTTWYCFARILCSISLCLIGYGTFNRFFVNDIWIVINLIVFAFTNGSGGTLAMMYGPQDFADKDKENASKMMSFFLTFGIFFGSFLAQTVFANLF